MKLSDAIKLSENLDAAILIAQQSGSEDVDFELGSALDNEARSDLQAAIDQAKG